MNANFQLDNVLQKHTEVPVVVATVPQERIAAERRSDRYTMIGYDSETPSDAERRIERVFELGFMPFCQLYQPDETKTYPEEWRKGTPQMVSASGLYVADGAHHRGRANVQRRGYRMRHVTLPHS